MFVTLNCTSWGKQDSGLFRQPWIARRRLQAAWKPLPFFLQATPHNQCADHSGLCKEFSTSRLGHPVASLFSYLQVYFLICKSIFLFASLFSYLQVYFLVCKSIVLCASLRLANKESICIFLSSNLTVYGLSFLLLYIVFLFTLVNKKSVGTVSLKFAVLKGLWTKNCLQNPYLQVSSLLSSLRLTNKNFRLANKVLDLQIRF